MQAQATDLYTQDRNQGYNPDISQDDYSKYLAFLEQYLIYLSSNKHPGLPIITNSEQANSFFATLSKEEQIRYVIAIRDKFFKEENNF